MLWTAGTYTLILSESFAGFYSLQGTFLWSEIVYIWFIFYIAWQSALYFISVFYLVGYLSGNSSSYQDQQVPRPASTKTSKYQDQQVQA